jgi:MFS family permease
VNARTIRHRFLLLRALRFLPTGLLIPVTILLLTERGFSLGQIGLVMAAQGVLVLFLELPTGGLADALGRRPVLLAATVIELVSVILLIFAYSLPLLAVVWALQGVYRALESGPLDAWYVDAALAADPDADIEGGLSAGGAAIGAAIASGALLAGGLVALDPWPAINALAVPLVVSAVLRCVEIGSLAGLMTEPRESMGWLAVRASVAAVPQVVRDTGTMVRCSGVLLALVSVELFWGFGMEAFEMLMPPRLAEVVGDADHAAALLGPTGSAAWLASAVGAAVIPLVTRRFGSAATAAGMRVVQGLTVIGMALAAGPAGVIAAYLMNYAVHGAANPVHFSLLHRQVGSDRRATVLSVNSMVALSSGAIGGIVLGWLADTTSVPVAMIVGAVALSAAAPLYLPAHRAERRQRVAVAASC